VSLSLLVHKCVNKIPKCVTKICTKKTKATSAYFSQKDAPKSHSIAMQNLSGFIPVQSRLVFHSKSQNNKELQRDCSLCSSCTVFSVVLAFNWSSQKLDIDMHLCTILSLS